MNKRRKNNYIILGLCAVVVLMGIGYAAFSNQLNITGTSNITSEFKVLITGVQTGDIIGNASNESDPIFTDDSATLSANLEKPGDSISYNITVENQGTLDAVIDSIKINAPEQDVIVFSVEGITSKEELLAGGEKTFTVTLKYNENVTSQPDITEVNFTVDLEYLQKGNSSNFSDADLPETEEGFGITNLQVEPGETNVKATITADNAIKYYYSLDNDKWYETEENSYTIYQLKPNTEYFLYVKAENADGEVVFSSSKFKTTDKTNPKVLLSVGANVLGENNWYKGLDINVEVSDNDAVANTKYCTTTEDTCTPDKEIELIDNKGTVQFTSNKDSQKVCVTATDRVGNETTECTDKFNVDSEVPTISNVTVTPDDDTMTIEVEGNDSHSGIQTYYFSKDGGSSYIESSNPNYTFTNLEEADYLVVVYVQDKAGNISETSAKTTTIRHASFCEHNDINNFGDCIIATEAGETDVELAKQEIEAKGEPNFMATSPSIVYNEVHATSTSTYSTGSSDLYIGTGYTFNSTTGMYSITNGKTTEPSTLDFSNGQEYYTNNTNWNATTATMYKITNVTTSTNSSTGQITYTLTKYNYTQTPASYDTSGVGLYAGEDNDGTTYYYRGSVGGNYVKFADKYWRIVRVNGDGTVRLIYDGTSAHANGEASSNRQIGTSAFNSYINDNAYVGYMYGDVNNFTETDSGDMTFNYTGLSSSAKYYFGTDYTLDEKTRSFKLSGDLHTGTLSSDEVGYYTCFSTSSTASCQRLFYTTKYNSSTSMTIKAKGYGSTSIEGAHSNVTNSTMKTYLDNWYQNNLSSYSDKISNEAIFCNNRNKSSKASGTYNNAGYGINPTIYGYERFINRASQGKLGPTLMCDTADSFSVSNTKGNGDLDYSVGLITADEVNMAGGINGSVNSLYYLYTGTTYWTMSPSRFDNWFCTRELGVAATGELANNYAALDARGARPVINLGADNLTVTGSGTKEDPFVVS